MFKKSLVVASIAAGCMASTLSFGQTDYNLDTDNKVFGYAVGMQIGQQIFQQFAAADQGIDIEALSKAINDVLLGKELLITAQAAEQAILARQQQEMENVSATEEANRAAGEAYLAENRKKDGVTETESGLQYLVIESGDQAGDRPTPADTVVVHYEGRLIDGTIFDSSYNRGQPATFPLNGIVPGWQEVLQLMHPGDKWEVTLPSELGYGARGAGGLIGPYSTLVFDIQLLEIK